MATSRWANFSAQEPHADAARNGQEHQAPEWRNTEQHGGCGPGEAHVRERVPGEGLAPQDEEVTDGPGHERDGGGGGERVPHEVVVKHGRDLLRAGRSRPPSGQP